ncbi:hypothetical protein BZA05DRAFT_449464 [Tricharina praecox]|uniref:uncharacterized protein n=1 Tax=Tricharina praecox TaxID=43433 RepID=UPI0022201A24|nr:uncharacterized protein BZA05DRAFT_449464 [Tricharina praecox]KAI5841646.1 hypothetical protein BZA05DRAFT_449464 [Tricharina praecox]
MFKRTATDEPEGDPPAKWTSRTASQHPAPPLPPPPSAPPATPASVPGPGHAVHPGASTGSKRRATEDPDGAKLPHAENSRRPVSGFSPPPALTELRDRGLVKRAEELVVAAQDCWKKGNTVAVALLADEIRQMKKMADTRTDLSKPTKTKVLGAFRQILTWEINPRSKPRNFAEAVIMGRADAEARARQQVEADARAGPFGQALVETDAQAQARARDAELQRQAMEEIETNRARAQAEADVRAKAVAQAQAEAEAKARAWAREMDLQKEAAAKAQAATEARARAQADKVQFAPITSAPGPASTPVQPQPLKAQSQREQSPVPEQVISSAPPTFLTQTEQQQQFETGLMIYGERQVQALRRYEELQRQSQQQPEPSSAPLMTLRQQLLQEYQLHEREYERIVSFQYDYLSEALAVANTQSEAGLLETYQRLVLWAQQQPELLRMGGVSFIWLCEQRWQQLEQLRH